MKDPNIEVQIKHSETKSAWKIVGIRAGLKYNIARCEYLTSDSEILTDQNRKEAFEHAEFIAHCFNNSNTIIT